MSTTRRPRKGSLQFWPRKRARKFLPRVNWSSINSKKTIKGFICYKAGMASAYVRDDTPNSMTKGKNIIVPVTVLECPPMKIFSIRFYKNGQVKTEILAENPDKELKGKIKMTKKKARGIEEIKDYDDLSIICYSQVKKTGMKKNPDLSELGLSGTLDEKLNFVKENLGKEINVSDIFDKKQIIDIRGLTKGQGFSGPVKRFGITLKSHKSEKGRRRPGSLGPWHPARVTYKTPMAGQLGMFTRVTYNNSIIDLGKSDDKFKNIKNYGNINTDYLIVRGSVQGPSKRQLLVTYPLRETKEQAKKAYELLELR
ncbi:MAG: 50S ribosomal protein L3 [Candidatus Pacearchaeota archaeon]|nr:50S ribosomal protein L3 [Nanoarchaeota archaeon]MDZ4226784.1 50S ribosomal protein L3 [Candidatus Pacearchaeota archaeon]